MSRKFLIVTIILVLVILFELSILGKICTNNDSGFFINLSTTFIGLIIATIIAEIVIRNYESKIISKTDRRIIFQINRNDCLVVIICQPEYF